MCQGNYNNNVVVRWDQNQSFWMCTPPVQWNKKLYTGLFKLCAGMSNIGQTFCRSGQNWSNFLQKQDGLVKLSVGAGGIRQTSSWSGRDWSNCTWECEGLDKLFKELVKSICGSNQNREFLWEQEGVGGEKLLNNALFTITSKPVSL